MTRESQPKESDWIIPVLGITLALALAIGIGFLMGQQTLSAASDASGICNLLPSRERTANCIALRSAMAAEKANSVARWGLWVAFGSLVASSGAIVGLMVAYWQGQRTAAISTEANRISTANGMAQTRAYVVIQTAECRLSETGQLTARVTFHNSGLSPARRLRWLYNAHIHAVYPNNESRRLTLSQEPDLNLSHWRHDIPSAGSWMSNPFALRNRNDAEIHQLLRDAVLVAVTVKVVSDYLDVFNATHSESACFQGVITPNQIDGPFVALQHAQDYVFEQQEMRKGS